MYANTFSKNIVCSFDLKEKYVCKRTSYRANESSEAIEFISQRIRNILLNKEADREKIENNEFATNNLKSLAKGRFIDFTCSMHGEQILESLFQFNDESSIPATAVVNDAIRAMQSLLVMGLQVGITGPPQYLDGLVQHLRQLGIEKIGDDIFDIGVESRRLKFERDTSGGTDILASLMRKRTAQGAFDLLVDIGVWSKHEDLSVLRR